MTFSDDTAPSLDTSLQRAGGLWRWTARGHLPPVFAQLADLVHHRALLDLVQGDRGRAEPWVSPAHGRQVQHTLREQQHCVQVAEGVCVLSLRQSQSS